MIDWLTFLLCLFGSFVFICFVFAMAQSKRRYDLIDVAWGLAFIAIAVISYTSRLPVLYSVQTIVTALVVIWGLRLSIHIYSRWDKAGKEDRRYAELRETYRHKKGGVSWNMFIRVYSIQAVLAVVISLPVIVINTSAASGVSIWSILGVIVWAIGFFFEAVGDYQLKKYLAMSKSKNRLMTSGLWQYTRHPNYFGEATIWWGVYLLLLPSPLWLVGLVGPLTITILLLFVSGVPLAEKHFAGKKGWNEYAARTSRFLPLPPKRGKISE